MRLILFTLNIIFCLGCYSQSSLNNLLSTYSSNFKVSNAPKYINNFHDTRKVIVSKKDEYVTVEYGFGWMKDLGHVSNNKLKLNLRTVSFYTGYWNLIGGKWEHVGKKNILTIYDENGLDLFVTGLCDFNKGTEQSLITKIMFDFGTEPIANRVINELLALQEGYKEKDPWLLPPPEPLSQNSSNVEPQKSAPQKNGGNTKTVSLSKSKAQNSNPKKSKSGKYGE